MIVRERMTPNPFTITTDMSVPDALHLMREKNMRHLPVLDAHGKLVGIVAELDLLYASPSPATSLSLWELPELLSKLKVTKVMSTNLATVTEDTPLEEAARIMSTRKIGALLVVRGEELVGIITETDMFRAFLQLLGGLRSGVRVSARTSGAKGTVAKITNAIFNADGDIVGLGFSEVPQGNELQWHITIKVKDVPLQKLVEVLKPVVLEILNVREM